MAEKKFEKKGLLSFFGGISVDAKLGANSQFQYARSVDFRKRPSQFSILPGTSKTSGGIVTDLVLDMIQVGNGTRYSIGNTGSLYKTTTSEIWSLAGVMGENSGGGIAYRAEFDNLYIPCQTKIARYKNITTSPTLDANWFQRGKSTYSGCYKTGGTNAYTVPVIINDTSTTDRRSIVSDIEPLYSIKVYIKNKGTGNWTLTLHDDANNTIAISTMSNADLRDGQLNEFVFSSPVRIKPNTYNATNGLTYHYHLTSTVADGSVYTTTANSLADCDMELWANALIQTNNGLHPTINFLNLTLIGNGRYVTAYEPLQDSPTTSDLIRHRLTLPPGYEVCSFAQKNLMCIIGAEKRSSSGEFQSGALFFWDGISTTYNDWWVVPEGSPEALFSHKNTAYYFAGGALYQIRGTDEPVKIRTMKNTDSEYSNISDTTHCYPNMMAVRRGVLLMGYPSYTTNLSLEHGVYSYGSISREYPVSFGYNYTISTTSRLNNGTNNLKIGMIKNFNDTLYISWRDDGASPTTYGVDIVNNSSAPATNFDFYSLYFDANIPYKQKLGIKIVATFDSLPTDSRTRLKFRIDGGSWEYGEYVSSGTYIVLPINKRFYGIEFGMEGEPGSTTLNCQSIFLFYDPLRNERELP